MLSQLRWMLFVALGLGVMVATWLDPNFKDPTGEPTILRTPRNESTPVHAIAPKKESSEESKREMTGDWDERFAGYQSERAALLAKGSISGEARELEREKLLVRYFDALEIPGVRMLTETLESEAK